MNTQVCQSTSKIVEWLQTAGVAYGMRIVAALVILLVGAIAIRIAAKALEKLLEKTRLGEKSLVAKFLVSAAVKADITAVTARETENTQHNTGMTLRQREKGKLAALAVLAVLAVMCLFSSFLPTTTAQQRYQSALAARRTAARVGTQP